MSSECPSPPRLVRLHKWDNFPGYGFNLHAEKARPGQYIGKIDPGSPSEAAGLREGDRIVEVNGVNVGMENHKQVVGRIKSSGTSCSLLVVDKECDLWHKEQGVVVRSSLPYTIISSSKEAPEEEEEEEEDDEKEEEEEEEEKLDLRLQVLSIEDEEEEEEEATQRAREEDDEGDSAVSLSRQESSSPSEASTDSGRSSSSCDADKSPAYRPIRPGGEERGGRGGEGGGGGRGGGGGGGGGGLDLNMSAKEMRARIGEKKKRDPRMEGERLDWWQRHHIVQTL